MNAFHERLRALSNPPEFAAAISFTERMIAECGYEVVKRNPGMRAWVNENREALSIIAKARHRNV